MDREEKDIIEGIAAELHGIRTALEALVAIASAPEEEAEAKPQPVLMDMGLDALFVSRRAENCLRSAGCRTIADVARWANLHRLFKGMTWAQFKQHLGRASA